MILGADWLCRVSPILMDYEEMYMEIKLPNGQRVTLLDETLPSHVEVTSACNFHRVLDDAVGGAFLLIRPSAPEETLKQAPPKNIQSLLENYRDVFQEIPTLPPARACDHKIPLVPDAKIVNIRPYRLPHHQKNVMEGLIKEMISKNIIRDSTSPYSSPALLVKKKDSSWRLCNDFRKVNEQTVKNKYPLPVIEDLLDELHGAKIFSKIDLTSGYHQIRMNEADIHKTAFATHMGHYEYLVMPFGLTNAPATFQLLMNTILAKYLRKFVLVFFDDILIFSETEEEHIEHLKQVFETLRKNQLYANYKKCIFGQSQVEYLGHIISKEGVATDPTKITSVVNWPVPTSVTELRSFLGLTGYYRRFVQDYGYICKPLFQALKKDGFVWGEEQQSAFNTLKQQMTTAPVLALPDFSQPFVLEADACQYGIGAVLMQNGRPLSYFSKTLGPRAKTLSTYDKEAIAILEALKKWKHYFAASSVIIRTDQESLKYIQEQKLTEGIQHKLLIRLLGYNFSIEYKKGKTNKVADALSRVKCQLNAIAGTAVHPVWATEVIESYKDDPKCKELLAQLALSSDSSSKYKLQQGLLRYKNRIVVGNSPSLKTNLLTAFHSSELGGHSGQRATYQRLKLLFYWPGMKSAVKHFIQECPVCQINKPEHCRYPGLLQPLPTPLFAWTHISMDFVEGLPLSNGKDLILVVVDKFTKYSHFIPLKHPITVKSVATAFIDNIFKLHGLPCVIVTDRDKIFTSHLWQDLFKRLGVKLHLSTSYHPQTDGQTERVNQCLENYLRCMAFHQPKKWCYWLSLAEWWYNTSFHTAHKMTPFQAVYGRKPTMVAEAALFPDIDSPGNPFSVSPEDTAALIKQHLLKAKERMKFFADKNRSDRSFQPGDMVYLKIQPYRHTSLSIHRHLKLHSKYYGPFRILQKIGHASYKLLLPEGCQLHDTFHVSQLKQHLGPKAVPNPKLPLLNPDGSVLLEPEQLLERKLVPRKQGDIEIPVVRWLIKWKNLLVEEATWEDSGFIQKVFPAFHP